MVRKLVVILGGRRTPQRVAQVILENSFAEPGVTFEHDVILVNDLGFGGEVHGVSFLRYLQLRGGV